MHHLHSTSAVFCFRITALLICLKCALCPLAAALLGYAIVMADHQLVKYAIAGAALCIVLTALHWIVAEYTKCPLCITPVLAKRNCAKNRHARAFLGSHRLRAALAIVFKNSFRCPYCHEPTVLEVRKKHPHSPYSRG